MNFTLRGKQIGRFVAALFALAAGHLLVPTEVSAGCDNHLVHTTKSQQINALTALTILELGEPNSLAKHELKTESPVQSPAPCSGPSCSKKSNTPLPPSVKTTEGFNEWACLPCSPYQSPKTFEFLKDEIQARPICVGTSLDRPPRDSSLPPQ